MPAKKGKKAGKKGPAAPAAAAKPADETVEAPVTEEPEAQPEPQPQVQANAEVADQTMEDWPPKELFQFMTLEEEKGKEYPVRGSDSEYVQYVQYSSFDQMQEVMDMMAADLSEPYPIFTYRYFIDSWPDLCWTARLRDRNDPSVNRMVGAITCKAAPVPKDPSRIRGYVAMLAVLEQYRNNGFGRKLVMLAIDTMKKKGCTEVVLETETGNSGALNLYEGLGFVRDKRLEKYYQQGTDAYRLKLWLDQDEGAPQL